MVFAQDRQGQSASDNLEIVVRQYSGSRLVNHQFEIEFSFAQWNPNLLRNWKIQVRVPIYQNAWFGGMNIHQYDFIIRSSKSNMLQLLKPEKWVYSRVGCPKSNKPYRAQIALRDKCSIAGDFKCVHLN